MSNERRGSGVRVIVYVLLAIWATTALSTIAIRTLHVFTQVAFLAITAALVVFVLRAVTGGSRSNEEEH